MQIKKTLLVTIAASAFAAGLVVEKRDTALILNDFADLHTKVVAFKALVDKFNNIFDGIPIPGAATTMQNAVKKLTTDITAAAAFSQDDSTKVTAATGTLKDDCIATLQSVENKADKFKSAGVTSKVADALNQLDAVVKPLADAILAKVTATDKPTDQADLDTVNAKLAEAKTKFQKRLLAEFAAVVANMM